jgi:hypothetical protein
VSMRDPSQEISTRRQPLRVWPPSSNARANLVVRPGVSGGGAPVSRRRGDGRPIRDANRRGARDVRPKRRSDKAPSPRARGTMSSRISAYRYTHKARLPRPTLSSPRVPRSIRSRPCKPIGRPDKDEPTATRTVPRYSAHSPAEARVAESRRRVLDLAAAEEAPLASGRAPAPRLGSLPWTTAAARPLALGSDRRRVRSTARARVAAADRSRRSEAVRPAEAQQAAAEVAAARPRSALPRGIRSTPPEREFLPSTAKISSCRLACIHRARPRVNARTGDVGRCASRDFTSPRARIAPISAGKCAFSPPIPRMAQTAFASPTCPTAADRPTDHRKEFSITMEAPRGDPFR